MQDYIRRFGARKVEANALVVRSERGLRMGVHCHPCGRHVVIDPATLPLSPELPVPSLERRFRCTRCGSKQTEARPEWPGR